MISIDEFPQCEVDGDTVQDLINLLVKLDPNKKLYFLKVSYDGNEVRDVYNLTPTKSETIDGTEDGYTIVL
ncbi:hypothetical protein P7G87_02765 [Enterococcus asini]|uniref:hypothetical protein n=1 Tax=Enterococcus asini TaxID=57732 RepID=UPI00288F8E59|nr:hypothetical protein [Enterococcus asini]MDT2783615.1 hypothetical protein [Enterococcus asini]